ncbi:hypothetical protein CQW23_27745 [Capsicum baccatum]|uniref:Uncharacterized protein n=1 Tax=Capsicum baccatum TaxID=33114 RepID=A0A2G2VEP1_CAPBA|nr:hypothetical protein CQW23_27745 [Capsicum baccatum]
MKLDEKSESSKIASPVSSDFKFEEEKVEEVLIDIRICRNCGLYMITYVECLTFGEAIPSVGFDPDLIHTKYASLLRDYGSRKEEVKAQSVDETPMRPPKKIGITEDTEAHDL